MTHLLLTSDGLLLPSGKLVRAFGSTSELVEYLGFEMRVQGGARVVDLFRLVRTDDGPFITSVLEADDAALSDAMSGWGEASGVLYVDSLSAEHSGHAMSLDEVLGCRLEIVGRVTLFSALHSIAQTFLPGPILTLPTPQHLAYEEIRLSLTGRVEELVR